MSRLVCSYHLELINVLIKRKQEYQLQKKNKTMASFHTKIVLFVKANQKLEPAICCTTVLSLFYFGNILKRKGYLTAKNDQIHLTLEDMTVAIIKRPCPIRNYRASECKGSWEQKCHNSWKQPQPYFLNFNHRYHQLFFFLRFYFLQFITETSRRRTQFKFKFSL